MKNAEEPKKPQEVDEIDDIYGSEGGNLPATVDAGGAITVPQGFYAPVGDAASSVAEAQVVRDFGPKIQKLTIDTKGIFQLYVPVEGAKGNERRVIAKELVKPGGIGAEKVLGIRAVLGDGSKSGESLPVWRHAKIWLEDVHASALTNLFLANGIDVRFDCGYLTAYGDCTGGITPVGIRADIYDAVVSGLILGADSVDIGQKINLTTCPLKGKTNWQDKSNRLMLFSSSALREKKARVLENTRWFWEIEKLKTYPFSIPVVKDDSMASLCLSVTDFQGKSFALFQLAARTALAISTKQPVSQVSMKAVFELFQKTAISVTTGDETTNYGVQKHLRFWAPLKERLGVSLWEAMQSRQFAEARENKATAIPYAQDKIKEFWTNMSGTIHLSQDGRMVLDTENIRKTL